MASDIVDADGIAILSCDQARELAHNPASEVLESGGSL